MAKVNPSSPLPTLRAARGVAQAELAVAVGVSPATMCRLERGSHHASDEVLARIAAVLRCPVEVVTEGDFILESVDGRVEVRRAAG